MAKKVKLADVLWEAANERLATQTNFYDASTVTASCCAAYWAERGHDWRERPGSWREVAQDSVAVMFLRELGCPIDSSDAFDCFRTSEDRQGARYMWLLLAMHAAEDEGIEIDGAKQKESDE